MSGEKEAFKNKEGEIPESSSLEEKNTNCDADPLVNPSAVRKSSKDPNRGLYPRRSERRKIINKDVFDKAKASTSSTNLTPTPELYKSRFNSCNAPKIDENSTNMSNNQPGANKCDTSFVGGTESSSHKNLKDQGAYSNIRKNSPRKQVSKKQKTHSSKTTTYSHFPENKVEMKIVSGSDNLGQGTSNCNALGHDISVTTIPPLSNMQNSAQNKLPLLEGWPYGRLIKNYSTRDDELMHTFYADVEYQEMGHFDDTCEEMHCSTYPEMSHGHKNKNIPICHRELFKDPSNRLTQFELETSKNEKCECSSIVGKNSFETTQNSDGKNFYFGLFGSTNECDEAYCSENYFQYLPEPVLEIIFSHVPFVDLCNLKLVCQTFNQVISNNAFLPWKTAYYALKWEAPTMTKCWEEALHGEIQDAEINTCWKSLIMFMSKNFKKRSSINVMHTLKNNLLCDEARFLIEERFPELNSEPVNPWCLLTAVILLSRTVDELYEIFSCILKKYYYEYENILEFMFCCATILFHYMATLHINHGFHYRLYHVIYLIENGKNTLKYPPELNLNENEHVLKQKSKVVFPNMTIEQEKILNHNFQPHHRVKVDAFAGTGKTSILIQIARKYPHLKFMNILPNRSVAEHASQLFPSNVTLVNLHSLAFATVGKMYEHKLRYTLEPRDITPFITTPESVQLDKLAYAQFIVDTIKYFAASADENISCAHVPKSIMYKKGQETPAAFYAVRSKFTKIKLVINNEQRLVIAEEAKKLWQKMVNRQEVHVMMTKDIYLKIFQLSHPILSEYDFFMVDEAHDYNAAMLDIPLSQGAPVLLMGDCNQRTCYSETESGFQSAKVTHTYYLTKSFRFGPEIGYIASCCVEKIKKNPSSTIVGSLKQSHVSGIAVGQCAIICNTLSTLLVEVIRLCCTQDRRPFEPATIQGAFVGGIVNYGLDLLCDIYKLKYNTFTDASCFIICSHVLKYFEDYDALYFYAKKFDREMLQFMDIVSRYNANILSIVATIRKTCSYELELANIVFSTVHMSKSHNFDTVILGNDFDIIKSKHIYVKECTLDVEFKALYTAITRANKSLIISEKVFNVVLLPQEKFQYLSSSLYLDFHKPLVCPICLMRFSPDTNFVLYQKEMILSCGRTIHDGALCLSCSRKSCIRLEVHRGSLVMLLDSLPDNFNVSMLHFVSPLTSDSTVEEISDEHLYDANGEHEIIVIHRNP